jgi:hypothetical protein
MTNPITVTYPTQNGLATVSGFVSASLPTEFSGVATLSFTFDLNDARLPDPMFITMSGDFQVNANNLGSARNSQIKLNILDQGITAVYDVPDIYNDDCVNNIDLLALIYAYGSTPGDVNYNGRTDISIEGFFGQIGRDGIISFADLVLMAQFYGTCAGQPVSRIVPRDQVSDLRVDGALQLSSETVDGQLIVTVSAENMSDLYAHHLQLSYPADILTPTTIESGDFLSDGGIETAFIPVIGDGVITLDGSSLGQVGGVSGSGVLATITFEVKQTGSYDLEWLTVQALNSQTGTLSGITADGTSGTVKWTPQVQVPAAYALRQNYPNPFNPKTTIKFDLPVTDEVNLSVYDLSGKLVQTLVSGSMDAGYHQVVWNGTDEQGQSVSSGVYLYRLSAGTYQQTQRMILMK